ncbi:putative bifunctional diguanylate cyclase/phosphodiesterase [Cellulomonas soli]|uniref:putative bifunctional diguanylate cyclase/phosphodiesterase n=1 Tax=Cellulomonas soli TaxID=931535 RepID=UPI003F86534F
MLEPSLTWVSILQLLGAGVVSGFCASHWLWWRGEQRDVGALGALSSSAVIAAELLRGGMLPMIHSPALTTGVELVRVLLVAAIALLALPTTRALTEGPPVRAWLLVTGSLLVVRVAWSALAALPAEATSAVPDMVLRPEVGVATLVIPIAVVVGYLAVASGSRSMSARGLVLVIGGTVSVVALTLGTAMPDSSAGPALLGLWPLPLAVVLEVFALRRMRRTQRRAVRQRQLHEAVARLSNTAWFVKEPETLLARAVDTARELLGDPTLEGSLRTLSHGRFVAELHSAEGTHRSPAARSFLLDLAQIVSAAAERHALAHRLSRTAFTDALTGLPNRHAVDQHLAETLEQANVERTRVALVYSDVDGFKRVNDTHGHARGDDLLVRVGDFLQGACQDGWFVGRLGGDEFVLVVPRAPADNDLLALARALRHDFGALGPAETLDAQLTVGVAAWDPGDVIDPDGLLRQADTAMLEAKRTASGYRVFDRALRRRVASERHRRTELEDAVREERFTAYFQPVADARTLEVVAVETLARWDHHGRMLLPADWLPLAEDTGLIVPIGLSVLRQARRALERFQLPVAVNVAARQLAEPDFLEQVSEAWGEAFWEHLTLEITESTILRTSSAVPALEALRARGARIALDDFGTGYSSLARLARLPVDVLKIDRSFVKEVSTERGRAVLRTIVDLARAHELDIVAEGVEGVEELTALVELGVPHVQGNMLGRAAATVPIRGPRPSALVPRSTF